MFELFYSAYKSDFESIFNKWLQNGKKVATKFGFSDSYDLLSLRKRLTIGVLDADTEPRKGRRWKEGFGIDGFSEKVLTHSGERNRNYSFTLYPYHQNFQKYLLNELDRYTIKTNNKNIEDRKDEFARKHLNTLINMASILGENKFGNQKDEMLLNAEERFGSSMIPLNIVNLKTGMLEQEPTFREIQIYECVKEFFGNYIYNADFVEIFKHTQKGEKKISTLYDYRELERCFFAGESSSFGVHLVSGKTLHVRQLKILFKYYGKKETSHLLGIAIASNLFSSLSLKQINTYDELVGNRANVPRDLFRYCFKRDISNEYERRRVFIRYIFCVDFERYIIGQADTKIKNFFESI